MNNGILNENDSNMLVNAINNRETLLHQQRMELAIVEAELVFVKAYGLVPFKDGNQWCVLLGSNLQEGIAGFGNTPQQAIVAFNKAFYNP